MEGVPEVLEEFGHVDLAPTRSTAPLGSPFGRTWARGKRAKDVERGRIRTRAMGQKSKRSRARPDSNVSSGQK